jgi:hypothetical protein
MNDNSRDFESLERRENERRVGVGRRILGDRRIADRRGREAATTIVVERRTVPDNRVGERRIATENRRKLADRRATSGAARSVPAPGVTPQ